MKEPCVYLLASKRNGTLYVGVTSDLVQRIWQHKNNLVEGFTKRYGVHMLVWYELCGTMNAAIARKKRLRNGNAIGRFASLKRLIQNGETCTVTCCNWTSSSIVLRFFVYASQFFLLRCTPSLSVIPAHAGIQGWMRVFSRVRQSRPWTPDGVYPERSRRAGVTVSSTPIVMRTSHVRENGIQLLRGGNDHDYR